MDRKDFIRNLVIRNINLNNEFNKDEKYRILLIMLEAEKRWNLVETDLNFQDQMHEEINTIMKSEIERLGRKLTEEELKVIRDHSIEMHMNKINKYVEEY